MTPTSTSLITDIAAVLQKDYAIGPDSATSIARRVLEMYTDDRTPGTSTNSGHAVLGANVGNADFDAEYRGR